MNLGVLSEIATPFNGFEAWGYDSFIAPSVVGFIETTGFDPVAELPAGSRLLDAGCGGGQILRYLAERRPDLRLAGLDLSPRQVARARRRLRSFGERVEIVQGSVLEMPFPEGSFDALVSVASLKHWPDMGRGLAECLRVLKPGGRLSVVEADRSCRLEDARRFVRRWRLPILFYPLNLAMFRTWVAGQAPDLDEARALAAPLPLRNASVGRIDGTPTLLIDGFKA